MLDSCGEVFDKTAYLYKNFSKEWFLQKLVLILFVLIGLFVRVKYAFFTELIGDESLSATIAQGTGYRDLLFQTGGYWDFVHPSLYYLLLKIWILFTPYKDWMFRLLSLLFFLPTTSIFYKILKKIYKEKIAVISTSLFSIHPLLITLGYQARMYAPCIFFFLLGFYFYLDNKNKKSIFLSSFFLALSFYFDYLVVWGFIGLLIIYLLDIKDKKRFSFNRTIKIFVYTFLLIIPQIFILLKNVVFTSNPVLPGSVNAALPPSIVLKQFLEVYGFFYRDMKIGLLMFFLFSTINILNPRGRKLFNISLFLFLLSLLISLKIPVVLSRHLLMLSLITCVSSAISINNFFLKKEKFLLLISGLVIGYYFFVLFKGHYFYFQLGLNNFSQKVFQEDAVVYFLPGTFDYVLTGYYFPQNNVNDSQWSIVHDKASLNHEIAKNKQYYLVSPVWCDTDEACSDISNYILTELGEETKYDYFYLLYPWERKYH